MSKPRRPALKGFGSKWSLAPWIIRHFPPHTGFLDVFFGTGSILLQKQPTKYETANDLNGRIYNYFLVLRDRGPELVDKISKTPWHIKEFQLSHEIAEDPLEDARRVFVASFMSIAGYVSESRDSLFRYGKTEKSRWTPAVQDLIDNDLDTVTNRLRNVQFLQMDVLESDILERFDVHECLIYVDPPYLDSVRKRKSNTGYVEDMGDIESHLQLYERLSDLKKAMVVISHTDCPTYNSLYTVTGWEKYTKESRGNSGSSAIEAIWLNQRAQKARIPTLL